MTEPRTVETGLEELLFEDMSDRQMAAQRRGEDPSGIVDVETFCQAGIHTDDRGLVLRMADGTEFQVTIVRSK